MCANSSKCLFSPRIKKFLWEYNVYCKYGIKSCSSIKRYEKYSIGQATVNRSTLYSACFSWALIRLFVDDAVSFPRTNNTRQKYIQSWGSAQCKLLWIVEASLWVCNVGIWQSIETVAPITHLSCSLAGVFSKCLYRLMTDSLCPACAANNAVVDLLNEHFSSQLINRIE